MLLPPVLFAPGDATAVTMRFFAKPAIGSSRGRDSSIEYAPLGGTPRAKGATGLVRPRYGEIRLGARRVAFALSRAAGGAKGGAARIVVDADGDGSLAGEAVALLPFETGADAWTGPVRVRLGRTRTVDVRVGLYRGDEANLLYFVDFGYDLAFRLDDRPMAAFVLGEPGIGTAFGIDRDGDGRFSAARETVEVGKPFNFTGTTYRFVPARSGPARSASGGGGLALERVAKPLPPTPLPPNLAVGRPALPIRAPGLDGRPVDLLRDYRGKLVLLDFWATWCGPCMEEVPNVRAAYARYHRSGFDVLGVNLDDAAMRSKLPAFVRRKGMLWRQVFEGKGWEARTSAAYDVDAIPFALLIDGDTGRIVARDESLSGSGLSAFIGKKLAERRKATR